MYFEFMYENRRLKPVEIVLRIRADEGGGKTMEGVNLRYMVSTYVNMTVYPCTTITC
jgi:hypothetical protein